MGGIPEILSEQSIIERDFFIFNLVHDAYRAEFIRMQNLDTKSNYIIGFLGVLLSFNTIATTFLINQIEKTHQLFSWILIGIFFSFIFLLASIYFSLIAIKIQTWTNVPDTEYLLKNYTGIDRTYHATLVKVTREFSNAINDNRPGIQLKADRLRHAIRLLILGISLFFLAVIASFIILVCNF